MNVGFARGNRVNDILLLMELASHCIGHITKGVWKVRGKRVGIPKIWSINGGHGGNHGDAIIYDGGMRSGSASLNTIITPPAAQTALSRRSYL